QPGRDHRSQWLSGQRRDRGADPARADRAQVGLVRLARDPGQWPRLRSARSRVRRAAAHARQAERDHRGYGAQQGPAVARGQARALVRAARARRGGAADRRAARRGRERVDLEPPGGAMMNAYERTLHSLAASDPDVIVMTAENRAAIRSLPAALGNRFIDVGVAEQTLVGMAAGLALRGRKPIVHALAAFLTMRAYEFIRTDIGIARLPVKLVGGVPGFLSDANGPTHQAIEDIALMRGIPGMKVLCPADEADLVASLPALLADPAPCYVRYTAAPAAFAHPLPGQPHRIETVADGDDVAILSFGLLVGEALDARARLAAEGVSARVL